MVTNAPKSDSFPSPPETIVPLEQCACENASFAAGRIRLEWNGLTGWRELRIVLHARGKSDKESDSQGADRDEQLIGEISEPFS